MHDTALHSLAQPHTASKKGLDRPLCYYCCTLLGVDNGWPDCFSPDDEFNCVLCSSLLGDLRTHPGQAQNTPCYLITELNPFKKVQIKVKICSSPTCSAMHQASVEKLGKI